MARYGARALAGVVCAIGSLIGCAGSSSSNGQQPSVCTPGVNCTPQGTAAGTGSLPPVGGVAGASQGITQGAAGMGVAPSGTADGVPCNVAQVVSNRCTGCHQNPTKFGAPMSLMTFADFHAASKTMPAKQVFEIIPTRINPTDPSKRMPPTSVDPLSAADNQTLTAWVTAGALAAGAGQSCAITPANLLTNPNGTAGTGTSMMTGAAGMATGMGGATGTAGATATPGMGGASIEPIEYNDPDMKCYKFLSHAPGGTGPYSASPGEVYMDFDFAAPWQGTMYERAIKLAIDPNSQVIHHWLLFKLTGPTQDGAVVMGTGTHPDGILLHGWAPGASPMYLDPDVGVQLEGSVGYQLEVHFNNPTGAPGNDQSGAEVCVTPHMPAHLAELSWVGTDSIAGTSASGTCSPTGPFPIHLIAAQPHMHKMGTHMKETIHHANGMDEVIHDDDFSFDNQRYYILSSTLMQGDTMQTDCSYDGFASFGPSTNQEMCYFFTLAWPAGALVSPGTGTIIHGADSCIP